MPMTYTDLTQAVEQDSAFRRRRRLQPAGGHGDKLPLRTKDDPPGWGGGRCHESKMLIGGAGSLSTSLV